MSFLNGTLNDDDLNGNFTHSYVFGDEGEDTLSLGDDSNSILDGWSGNDTLLGNSGKDFLLEAIQGMTVWLEGAGIDILAGDDLLFTIKII